MGHHGFNFFEHYLPFANEHNIHVISALFVSLIIIGLAFAYKLSLKSVEEEVVPSGSFSIKNIFQMLVEFVLNLCEDVIGPTGRNYLSLMGAIFIYILFNNLLGTFPGFSPATANLNTNLAISITIFFFYHTMGIRKQGAKTYLKHFLGPMAVLAVLIGSIELISHSLRPVTLAVRLFVNLTGDHIVLGIFSDLVPLVVPVIFMGFGIFVSLVQAFVFTLLSIIYVGLAVEQHEDHDAHGEHAH